LSLAQALRRATGQVGDLGVDRRDASPYDQLLPAVALGASGRMVPSQPLLLGLLLVFVLAAGPVGFIAAAKARRRWLYWFAPPLAGVLLAGSAYGLAQASGRGGVRDQVVETVVVSPDGTGLVTAFHALTLPGSAEWRASVPPGTMVSLNPSPEDHLRTRLGVSQLDQLGGLYAPAEEYVRFGPAEAVLRDVPAQSTRVLETRSVRLVGPWLFAHLAYRGGAIAGTVRNAGSEPVENALPAPYDSRTAVARAAGWGLSSYPGTFSLVAFGPPRSALLVNGNRPARSGLAAYAAPVRLETADSLPAGWSFARLVSQGVPDQPEELYEIGVPAGVRGDLRLLYLAPKGGLALSLWIYSSAARNWRNTLLQVGEAEVLQPGESDDGLVRILIGGVYRFTPDQLVVASGP
jgi:hypothetical protein